MVAKKQKNRVFIGKKLVKEVCRRIRVARSYWDAHNNAACRGEREKALALYETLTPEQKEQIPQQLRVWLRYRSENILVRTSQMAWRQNAFYARKSSKNSCSGLKAIARVLKKRL